MPGDARQRDARVGGEAAVDGARRVHAHGHAAQRRRAVQRRASTPAAARAPARGGRDRLAMNAPSTATPVEYDVVAARLRAHDRLVDAAGAGLEDAPEEVEHEVVADVVPAVHVAVEGVDRAQHRRHLARACSRSGSPCGARTPVRTAPYSGATRGGRIPCAHALRAMIGGWPGPAASTGLASGRAAAGATAPSARRARRPGAHVHEPQAHAAQRAVGAQLRGAAARPQRLADERRARRAPSGPWPPAPAEAHRLQPPPAPAKRSCTRRRASPRQLTPSRSAFLGDRRRPARPAASARASARTAAAPARALTRPARQRGERAAAAQQPARQRSRRSRRAAIGASSRAALIAA